MNEYLSKLAALAIAILTTSASHASEVKITPLGSHDGEFCARDRALILEDPNGTRLLFDAGQTIAGGEDERLEKIDVVLLSHVHGDHLGDLRISAVNEGECGEPETKEKATPASNTVDIAVKKKAKIVVGSEMDSFLANKVAANGGDAESVELVRFGASTNVGGVEITTVPAVHSNGLEGQFIEGELGESLETAGLTAYVGPPTGYVLTFSNGLAVYLSGDTGVTAEQETVVRDLYGAEVAIINIGDNFTTGPTEAAYVVNELIRPTSAIASHANEAATKNGSVIPNTKTELFIQATDVRVYIPLSGQTMSFDEAGECVSGCQSTAR